MPGAGVVGDVGKVACGTQQFLAAVQLAGDGIKHALDQHGLVFKVGNHSTGVRQVLAAEEGCAALEVHKHQVELVRRVRCGKRNNDFLKQFGLTTTGSSDAEPVWAHATER